MPQRAVVFWHTNLSLSLMNEYENGEVPILQHTLKSRSCGKTFAGFLRRPEGRYEVVPLELHPAQPLLFSWLSVLPVDRKRFFISLGNVYLRRSMRLFGAGFLANISVKHRGLSSFLSKHASLVAALTLLILAATSAWKTELSSFSSFFTVPCLQMCACARTRRLVSRYRRLCSVYSAATLSVLIARPTTLNRY